MKPCCMIVVFVQALTINDLQHVYEKLHESASPHWFDLGLALGLTYPVLTKINIKCCEDNVSSLREMLAKLLSTQHVTWSLLSDALKRPTVDLINLADSITGNYIFSVCAFFSLHHVSVVTRYWTVRHMHWAFLLSINTSKFSILILIDIFTHN